MFAVLFMKEMDPFYQNISSFPTVIFTIIFVLMLLYWVIAVLGLVDIGFLDFGLPEVEGSTETVNVLAGLFLKFGLNGVPVTVVLTLVSMFGWLISYYADHYLLMPYTSGVVEFLLGGVVLFVSLLLSALISAQVIKPLRKLFNEATTTNSSKILGQTLVVKTLRVDAGFGEAHLNDGGAGLVLKVRANGEEKFKKGDRVVAYEYLKDKNVYRVISEDEFLGNS
ncbi:DUF1449 domain-containing protein [Reinekea marina]|uniref:DUF1449 domain-containing protein n=1 Tax=Reinekea marina TaxID=1310421 RepID=A0ABV7WTU6_9GAMM|nr:DUF1449 domain-containing protein [Reinekea marina]MDN3648970.1 DUF1449 domain-containing protein [Reinekea marina]